MDWILGIIKYLPYLPAWWKCASRFYHLYNVSLHMLNNLFNHLGFFCGFFSYTHVPVQNKHNLTMGFHWIGPDGDELIKILTDIQRNPFRETKVPSQYKDRLYRYKDFHCKDKSVVRPSYLYHGNTYTGEPVSSYWDGLQKSIKTHELPFLMTQSLQIMLILPFLKDHLSFETTLIGGLLIEIPLYVRSRINGSKKAPALTGKN